MALAFLILALLVQLAMLVTVKATAQAAVDALARRAAVNADADAAQILAELDEWVPGASVVDADLARSEQAVIVAATLQWNPPGPRLIPLSVEVRGMAPVVEPP